MKVACYPRVPKERLILRFEEFGGIARVLFKVVDIEDGVDTNLDDTRRDQRVALIDVVANPNRIEYLENSNDILWTVFHMEHLFHCTR